jgi:hypothetical protein
MSFALIALGMIFSSQANAVTFASCPEGTAASQAPTRDQLYKYSVSLWMQFNKHFQLSYEEIQKDIACLNDMETADPDCKTRLEYFEKTLPLQWKKYRENLALSAWDQRFRVTHRSNKPLFNYSLNKPHPYWLEQVHPEGLSDDEIVDIQKRFDTESERIWKATLAEIPEQPNGLPRLGPVQSFQEGKFYLKQKDWGRLMDSGNYWSQKAVSRMEQLVYHLNKKRLIQQLVQHPILAFLEKPVIDHAGLVKALGGMKHNLIEEKDKVGQLYWNVIDHVTWKEQDLYPMQDYLSVVESNLAQHPEQCGVAMYLTDRLESEQFWRNLILGGIMIGALIFAPPVIAITGAVIFQGYILYQANADRLALQQSAFTNPAPSLQLRPVEEAYIQADGLLTETIMAPLALTGIPILRVSRLLSAVF